MNEKATAPSATKRRRCQVCKNRTTKGKLFYYHDIRNYFICNRCIKAYNLHPEED
jgi:hypothetical protein